MTRTIQAMCVHHMPNDKDHPSNVCSSHVKHVVGHVSARKPSSGISFDSHLTDKLGLAWVMQLEAKAGMGAG